MEYDRKKRQNRVVDLRREPVLCVRTRDERASRVTLAGRVDPHQKHVGVRGNVGIVRRKGIEAPPLCITSTPSSRGKCGVA